MPVAVPVGSVPQFLGFPAWPACGTAAPQLVLCPQGSVGNSAQLGGVTGLHAGPSAPADSAAAVAAVRPASQSMRCGSDRSDSSGGRSSTAEATSSAGQKRPERIPAKGAKPNERPCPAAIFVDLAGLKEVHRAA